MGAETIILVIALVVVAIGSVAGAYIYGAHCARETNKAWIDVVIYHGQERSISFLELERAALGVALEVSERNTTESSFEDLEVTLEDGRLVQRWSSDGKKLMLSIPAKPGKVGQLQRQPVALIDDKPPWEFAQPSLKQ